MTTYAWRAGYDAWKTTPPDDGCYCDDDEECVGCGATCRCGCECRESESEPEPYDEEIL